MVAARFHIPFGKRVCTSNSAYSIVLPGAAGIKADCGNDEIP
jgi:hypothetical protein